MGDIDDRFIVEVLNEDAAGVVHAKSAGQKKTAVIRFVRYALPSAAALLIAFVCVRSLLMTGGMQESATTSNYSAAETPSAGSMADAAKEPEVDSMMECPHQLLLPMPRVLHHRMTLECRILHHQITLRLIW